jgi:D-apionolactonase
VSEAVSRSTAQILTGRRREPAARVPLRAGSVTAVLDGPDLRGVRLGSRELAQRIYVAVRDEGWGTVPGVIDDLSVEQDADSFLVTFTSRHRQGPIDFEWRARFSGDADGTISCSMDGVAHSAFRYAKIGFNVHHPLLESVGRRYRAATPDGELVGRIERQIEPQRVLDGVLTAMFPPYSELAVEYGAGQEVVFSFAGDLFELQDHRNWSDGNFKSYGTPLAVPWPMDAEPGMRFRQRVLVRSEGIVSASEGAAPIALRLGASTGTRLPALGLGRAAGDPLDEHEAALIALARPRHLRVAVRLHEAGWEDDLARGLADCARLEARLELALSLEAGDDEQLGRVAAALDGADVEVARVLVLERQDAFAPAAPVTEPASLARARDALARAVGNAVFAAGSDQFFSDVNRNPPAADGLDAVCFGLCPQVHAADDTSLMENLPSLADAIATTRLICPGAGVVVSPVTLASRLGPYPAGEPGPGDPPADVDLRGHALFGASWTLGALGWLAREHPDSVTLYETAGAHGIVERTRGTSLAGVPSSPGQAFPVLHVLADVAERGEDELCEVESSDPLAVSALALRGGERLRVLVANHGPAARAVLIRGLPAAGVGVRMLDETSAELAMDDPTGFRATVDVAHATESGELSLEVGPYAVVRIDG